MKRDDLRPPDARLQRHAAGADDPGGDPSGQAAGAVGARAATAPLRVLVVEDLPRVQQLLRELIHEPGRLEVAGLAETEQDAVALYDQLLPQAVIVDLNLKSGTGLGVIASLRRRPPGAARPLLIVLTNHALPVLEAACLKAGADYFLDKSRDFHKVRTLLDHAWSRLGALPDAPASDSGAGTPSSGTTMH